MESEATFREAPGLDWNNGREGESCWEVAQIRSDVGVDVSTAQATLNVREMSFSIMNSL